MPKSKQIGKKGDRGFTLGGLLLPAKASLECVGVGRLRALVGAVIGATGGLSGGVLWYDVSQCRSSCRFALYAF
jgi:hypothetical protein